MTHGTAANIAAASDVVDKSGASFAVVVKKSAAPIATVAAQPLGVPLPDLVYYATLFWIALQVSGWLWDRFYVRRREARQLLCDLTGKDCDE